ncbi:MAG: hypothetical protein JOZ44_01045 [Acidobacteria bacterium]|nr:hypothetical protein [Acidobacteriota bacterium]
MTIFEAKEYDPRIEKRRRLYLLAGLVVAALIAFAVYHFWDWREERTVDHFLTAVEHNDFELAYSLWNADPNWKQHPQKYSGYNFATFEQDWGPVGTYGEIKSHHLRTALTPKNGSGVVVVNMVTFAKHSGPEPLALWVEKSNQSITVLPPTLDIHIGQ